jgi:NAD dependent epimerase/dehydratase family enzyme
LARAIGHALHRPALFPVPAFVLKTMFGEMAEVCLIRGQRVLPRRALELGYRFRHPVVAGAI